VLGHSGCGAVGAALEARLRGARQLSRIQILVDDILPGLESVDLKLDPAEMRTQAVEANVRWSIRQIRETPEAREYKAEGRAKLVGAIYEIETGRVRFLDE
jgi:carbonic anhydrase